MSVSEMMKLADAGMIEYYRTEYYREWVVACENGIRLTANDIRARLMGK
jgi:hypothetical protein